MRTLVSALVACVLPAIAHADDETQRCHVDYVTVPDGVEQVIDGWVAAEPQCRGTIALRVIPTNDGYFLFAERPDGTVHERLVPDLTAAGVLVASWVADSWHVDRPRKKKKARLEVRAVAVDESTRVEKTVEIERPVSERKRWIGFGPTLVSDIGFRLETDVIMLGAWKLGVAAQKVVDTLRVGTNEGMIEGRIDDWSAGALVSRTFRWGRWELRGAAGIFVVGSKLRSEDFYDTAAYPVYTYEIDNAVSYELSATLARDLGDRWGIGLTAASTFISQDWHGNDNMTWYEKSTYTREQIQPMWVVSLRRRI